MITWFSNLWLGKGDKQEQSLYIILHQSASARIRDQRIYVKVEKILLITLSWKSEDQFQNES